MSASLAGDLAILAGAALLTAGALLSRFAERFRAPSLLVFLALGMVIGDDGLDLISFSDAELAQQIGVVALVVILFEGGLNIARRDLRGVIAPASLLATVGVAVTAAVVAVAAHVVTDISVTTAALIGAVVASTDAAAVFAVLRRAPVPRRLAALLEVESGGNDPLAVLLTVGVLSTWQSDATAGDWLVFGLRQLLGGLLVGALVGAAAGVGLRRLAAENPTFHPVLALGAGGLAYGLATLVGASGFLAVFVAGAVVAAVSPRRHRAVRRFFEGLATVAQIALFLMLGLLVFPGQLLDVAFVGVACALVLMFVARPLAVALCLPWFGVRPAEGAFVAWAGLRGAVPIVLATFPLTVGYPDGGLIFDIVFFVVLTSALVQGLTIGPVAARLGLRAPDAPPDPVADLVPLDDAGVDVMEVELRDGHGVVGRRLHEVPLPAGARVGAILRGDAVEVPDGDTLLSAGDTLIVIGPSSEETPDALSDWAAGEDER